MINVLIKRLHKKSPLTLLFECLKYLQYFSDNIQACKQLCDKEIRLKLDDISEICREIEHLKKKTEYINFDLQNLESLCNAMKKKNKLYYPEEKTTQSNQISEKNGPKSHQSFGSKELEGIETLENIRNTVGSLSQLDTKLISKWDEQFMELRSNKHSSIETAVQLQDNFIAAAVTYSKMIIAERHKNIKDKKMKPMDIGGVEGGTKFLIDNLFFKYPVDTCIDDKNKLKCFLFGGNDRNDIYAAKATNHNLNGITYCMMEDVKNEINYPLSALIDYQGFRLTVMTYLPISHTTLIYGSDDGGETQKSDPKVHDILLNIASNLNLREHYVKCNEKTALCGDIKIHKLKQFDKEYFFGIDFARVFPPVVPVEGIPMETPLGSIFFRLLRPELVKKLKEKIPQGLSSDGLSGWQNPSEKQMNEDIQRASEFLMEQINNFAKELCNEKFNHRFVDMAIENTKQPSFNGIPFKDTIVRELHNHGINMRYIGLLVMMMDGNNPKMISFLVSLMVTRAMKNMWRKKIQKRSGSDHVHEVCLTITTGYYRGTHAILLVFDISNRKTYDDCSLWLNECRQHVNNKTLICIIGNKSDLDQQRVVTTLEAQEFAQENYVMYYETSCLTSTGIEELFQNIATIIMEKELYL